MILKLWVWVKATIRYKSRRWSHFHRRVWISSLRWLPRRILRLIDSLYSSFKIRWCSRKALKVLLSILDLRWGKMLRLRNLWLIRYISHQVFLLVILTISTLIILIEKFLVIIEEREKNEKMKKQKLSSEKQVYEDYIQNYTDEFIKSTRTKTTEKNQPTQVKKNIEVFNMSSALGNLSRQNKQVTQTMKAVNSANSQNLTTQNKPIVSTRDTG